MFLLDFLEAALERVIIWAVFTFIFLSGILLFCRTFSGGFKLRRSVWYSDFFISV